MGLVLDIRRMDLVCKKFLSTEIATAQYESRIVNEVTNYCNFQ